MISLGDLAGTYCAGETWWLAEQAAVPTMTLTAAKADLNTRTAPGLAGG
jgi:hypothetical protein